MLLSRLIMTLFSFFVLFGSVEKGYAEASAIAVELIGDSNQTGGQTAGQNGCPLGDEMEEEAPMISASYQKTFGKMILSLFGMIGVVFVGLWLLRKLSQNRYAQLNDTRTIKVIERRPISPKTILYLLDIGGELTLISESQMDVSLLSPKGIHCPKTNIKETD